MTTPTCPPRFAPTSTASAGRHGPHPSHRHDRPAARDRIRGLIRTHRRRICTPESSFRARCPRICRSTQPRPHPCSPSAGEPSATSIPVEPQVSTSRPSRCRLPALVAYNSSFTLFEANAKAMSQQLLEGTGQIAHGAGADRCGSRRPRRARHPQAGAHRQRDPVAPGRRPTGILGPAPGRGGEELTVGGAHGALVPADAVDPHPYASLPLPQWRKGDLRLQLQLSIYIVPEPAVADNDGRVVPGADGMHKIFGEENLAFRSRLQAGVEKPLAVVGQASLEQQTIVAVAFCT